MLAFPLNPFHIVGLESGYGAEALKKAYRRKCLEEHPDKNPNELSKYTTRFQLLRKAYDILEEALANGNAEQLASKYANWPETAVSGDKTYRQCTLCDFVCRLAQFSEHLEDSHGQLICGYEGCDEHFEEEGLITHRIAKHKFWLCVVCNDQVEAEYQTLHEDFHRCAFPSCGIRLAKGELLGHAENHHKIQACMNCSEPRRMAEHGILIHHLLAMHKTLVCELCQVSIAEDGHLSHLKSHGFQPCEGCLPDSGFKVHLQSDHGGVQTCHLCEVCYVGDDFPHHMREAHELPPTCGGCSSTHYSVDHIRENHRWEECDLCCGTFHAPDHCVSTHGWLLCDYCDDALPTHSELRTHRNAHVFRACGDCDGRIVQERYNEHLRHVHQRLECAFCKERRIETQPMTATNLRLHIEEEHPAKVKCPFPTCHLLQTENGLPFHLNEDHRWPLCQPCKVACPSRDDMEKHIADDHTTCEICGIDVPKRDHFTHVASHQNKYGGRCNMGECDEKFYKSLQTHQLRQHGYSQKDKKCADKPGMVPCRGGGRPHTRQHQSACKRCKEKSNINSK